ncbi:MAG: hypothetical protein AAGH15_17350 [Myxococcota bacterium]
MTRIALGSLCGALALVVGQVAAQEGGSAVVAPARSLGDYAGVSPSGDNPPPRAGRLGRSRNTLVTWPGFTPEPGGGRFFLQLTGAVESTTQASPGRFEVVLRNVGTHVRNTRRPLITRYHDTPVTTAKIERRGRRDLAFVFTLRQDVRPTVRQADGAGGFRYLFVEWPEGRYLPEEAYRAPNAGGEVTHDDDEVPPPVEL